MFINIGKFLMFIFILVFDQNHCVNSNLYPVKADLPIYLRALERVIHTAGTKYNEIDENFGLGLFLANVNIKSALMRKNETIPKQLWLQLQNILNKNKVSLNFFNYLKAYKHKGQEKTDVIDWELNNEEKYQKAIRMMAEIGGSSAWRRNFIGRSDEDTWAARLPKFFMEPSQLEDINKEHLFKKYSSWSWYERQALDYDNHVPTPEQSDMCMIYLSVNKERRGPPSYRCNADVVCRNFVEHGTEFGYALVHRVLYLVLGMYGRGCYVFSPELDDAFVNKLCSEIYEEAHYIALNNMQLLDLLMEQVSSCSLAGHAKFIQRKWMSRLLRQQTPRGCFSTYLVTVYSRLHQERRESPCHGHVSGVAAAALSAFVRYILETFY